MASKVFVGGASSSGKRTLLRGLAELCGDGDACMAVEALSGASGVKSVPLTLVTKYYTAKLELRVVLGDSFADPGLCEAELAGCEAAILVADVSKGGTDALLARAAGVAAVFSMETGVVVGSHHDERKEDTDYPAENAWCFDCGYEFVPADCTKPREFSDAREKQGVARVLETLQNTMWRSMEMATSARPSPMAAALVPADVGEEKAEASGTDCTDYRPPPAPTAAPLETGDDGAGARVFVGGLAGTGKRTLVRGLAHLCGATIPASKHDASVRVVSVPVHLSTKYYSAPIVFSVAVGDSTAHQAVCHDALERAEAAIFVVDISKPDAGKALAAWGPHHAALSRVETGVVVGAFSDKGVHAASAAAAEEWCRSRQFEFVEANCTDPMHSVGARDKAGVSRVLEVLENTMWTTMEYATAARPSGLAMQSQIAPSDSAGAGADDAASAIATMAIAPPLPAAETSTGLSRATDDDAALSATGESAGDDTMLQMLQEGLSGMLGADSGGQEDAIDSLASLFAEMQAVKENAYAMDDAARRHAASDLAMRLTSMLDSEGFTEGESDGGAE